MHQLLERRWWLDGVEVSHEVVSDPRNCTSLKWMCCSCGDSYAEVRAYRDHRPQPFSFIHGLCRHCQDSENPFNLSGSLECMSLVGWQSAPKPIVAHQFEVELSYAERQLP